MKGKTPYNFATMPPEKRRKLQSKGGKSVPAYKRAFTRDRQLASRAGKKGGEIASTENRPFLDKEYAREMRKRGMKNNNRDVIELAILRQGANFVLREGSAAYFKKGRGKAK